MSEMQTLSLPTYIFEFSAGRLCLDFVNTRSARASGTPRERLKGYADLVSWGLQAQVLAEDEARLLLVEDHQQAQERAQVLQRALAVREALYRLFAAVGRGELPAEADLAIFNAALAETQHYARIVVQNGELVWGWVEKQGELDSMLWEVYRSAANMLTSNETSAVKFCAEHTCDWMFLDTSKNRSRRWCNMKSCGNRAKVRKHHERSKQALI